MCLTVSSRNPPSEIITVYKEIRFIEGELYSPHFIKKIKPGWYKPTLLSKFSNAILYLLDKIICPELVSGGVIHVYNENVVDNISHIYKKYFLKCIGYPKDFIAYGDDNDIAFKKIYIPKEEYYKTLSLFPIDTW